MILQSAYWLDCEPAELGKPSLAVSLATRENFFECNCSNCEPVIPIAHSLQKPMFGDRGLFSPFSAHGIFRGLGRPSLNLLASLLIPH